VSRELKGIGYEIFMLLLSGLSIFNALLVALTLITSPTVGPGVQVVLLIEVALIPFFAFDFGYRVATTDSHRRYLFLGGGWADVIAIAPMLRAFRLLRMRRVGHLLRAMDGSRVVDQLAEGRATTTFLITVFLVVLVVEAAGATIFTAESSDPAANIVSAGDAVWWGLVTITTVGYGDYYPVTPLGRLIGVGLLFAGIALFSVLTGFIANVFLSPRRRPLLARSKGGRTSLIVELNTLLAEQDERTATIRARIAELERSFAAEDADADGDPPGATSEGESPTR